MSDDDPGIDETQPISGLPETPPAEPPTTPYAAPPSPGAVPPSQNPYGAAPQNPYGAAPQNPYGAAPQDPYAAPQNPYAAPQSPYQPPPNPYPQPGSFDQYAAPGAYGSHPYGLPDTGLPESLARITRADLSGFVAKYFAPNNCVLAIVGDVEDEPRQRDELDPGADLGNRRAREVEAEVARLERGRERAAGDATERRHRRTSGSSSSRSSAGAAAASVARSSAESARSRRSRYAVR